MRTILCMLLLIVIAVRSSMAGPSAGVRLLRVGTFLIQLPRITVNETWFGLFQSGSSWTLLPVKVTSEPAQPTCGKSAARISVDRDDAPLFLLSGFQRLSPGPVPTAVADRRLVYPGQIVAVNVQAGDGDSVEALGTAVHETGGAVLLNYSLWLRRAQRAQRIVSKPRAGLDNPPQLVWAGDIDRDSRPDLLLNVPAGDVGARYMLLLSSTASADQLVSEAAMFAYPGC